MRRIQLNSLQLNAVTINSAGERWRGSHAGAPPVVPDVPDIPDIPEEPDVPSDPDVDENGYIKFADPEVARICAENWGDGTGITPEQAEAVTSIGTVFKGNTEITKFMELPKFANAQAIPANAFNGCSALNSIDLSRVTSLGASALYNCTSLEIEDLQLPNLTTLGQNAFYGVKIKKISDLGKLTTLPTATTSTQNFGDKSVLEEVVLPSGISVIPSASFFGYNNLQKVDIGWITDIGGSAFEQTAITSLFLPNIETLRNSGVQLMPYIERIFLGGNLKVVEPYNFWRWSGTNDVYIVVTATTPPSMAGNNQPDWWKGRVYVPDEQVENYKETSGWASFASVILPISQLEIDNFDFYKEIEEYL